MNRTDLIYKVADINRLPIKQVDCISKAIFDEIKRELISGGKVQILGFGTFEARTRAPRKAKIRVPVKLSTCPNTKLHILLAANL